MAWFSISAANLAYPPHQEKVKSFPRGKLFLVYLFITIA